MFIVSLLTITLKWKKSKYPSMNEWISKTFTYNEICKRKKILQKRKRKKKSKRKKILLHVTTWIKLEDIMLNSTRQSQNDK